MSRDIRKNQNYNERYIISHKDQFYGGMKPLKEEVKSVSFSPFRKSVAEKNDTPKYVNTGKFIPYFVNDQKTAKSFKTKTAALESINKISNHFGVESKNFKILMVTK